MDQLAALQTLLALIAALAAAIGAYYAREQFTMARKLHLTGTTAERAWIKELVGVSVTVVGVGIAIVAGFYAYKRMPQRPAVPQERPHSVKDRDEGPPIPSEKSSPPPSYLGAGKAGPTETEVTVRPPILDPEAQTYTLRAEVAVKGSGELMGAVWFFRDGERLRPNALLRGKTAELAGVALRSDQTITAEFVPSQNSTNLGRSVSKDFVFVK